MASILIVDDDPSIRRTLEVQLRRDGHEVTTSDSGERALDALEGSRIDIAFLDLRLPGIQGDEVLRRVHERHPLVDVVVITAFGSIESAIRSIRDGAFDYLTKPFGPDEVRLRISQIERFRELKRENAALLRRVGELPFGGEFLTRNPATLEVLATGGRVAETDATVLITGESGTGKTRLAALIHGASARRDGPFVTVDCASLHDSLLESELFGHRRGAFTGAVADAAGKVALAEGGTLFLDEVGEIPLHLQGKLLRLVDEHAYERLGDPHERRADLRVIAASNRDLEQMVKEGELRADLLFRLSVVELTLPPLRSRPEDILLLAAHLVRRLAETHSRNVEGCEAEVEQVLLAYPWPGNVRELANVLERAVLLSPGPLVRADELPDRIRQPPLDDTEGGAIEPLAALEERHLRRVLALGLPLERTAELLGIDPSTLRRKRRRLGL